MLAGLGKLTELKQRILFVIGALVVYRLGSFIPVPGVNSDAMTKLIQGQGGIVDMFNMFSGGALARFSLPAAAWSNPWRPPSPTSICCPGSVS